VEGFVTSQLALLGKPRWLSQSGESGIGSTVDLQLV